MSQRRRRAEEIRSRTMRRAGRKLALNLAYAVYHGALGLAGRSWWFLAMFGYYAILGMTRFAAALCARRDAEDFITRTCGGLLLMLSLALAGVNTVSIRENIAARRDTIVMISIAAYVFYKLGGEIARAVRHRRHRSALLVALRSIGYAEMAASVVTLQRSMLVSFGDMNPHTARLMNALTGGAACAFIFALGINLISGGRAWKRSTERSQRRSSAHTRRLKRR